MEGSIIADRYVINGIIGSGGMAIVYRGYDRESGEEVAIKVLRSEFMQDDAYVRRFEKESQIAIKYSHKNIVKTIEVGCKDGRHYIVMEYVSGMTLKEYIAKYTRLKPPEVVRIGRQICDALFYAHSHQLIHRDIKPQNILISAEGIVKVADFGIAKAPETATVTLSGSNVLGSVHYISPEQARGGITDEKADIYSIGIVLYEMVTGDVPFTGDTPVAVALKHLQDAPRPPREIVPDMPKALELVILKAISKEQVARYDNAREMARDLERSILEPEGSYVKIWQPDESEGTRPMHPIKLEGLQPMQQQTMMHSNTGSRRPVPPRPQDTQWRRSRRPPAAVNVMLSILLAVGLLAGAYFGFKALVDSAAPRGIKLNDFRGQDITIAQQQLDTAKIPYKVLEKASDVDKGLITDQNPGPGEYLAPEATLELTVSSGKQQVSVPDVGGLTDQQAEARIKGAGLVVGDIRPMDSDKPKDTVVDQKPAAYTMLEIGGKVSIWISQPQGASGQKMPKLFGMNKDDATNLLLSMGVNVNNIKLVSKGSSFVQNIVIGQTPETDTPLDANTQVEIDVSTGVPPGYNKFYTVPAFDVAADNTNVKIVFVDGESKTTVFDSTLKTGHYADVTIPLDSTTLGEKEIIIYFDGKQQGDPIKVVFTAGDSYTNAG
jgi:eukaryotic-like serine/threonine-protein kinase